MTLSLRILLSNCIQMKLLALISCLYLFPVLTGTAGAFAQEFRQSDLDAFFDHLTEHQRFMGSVAILSGDSLVYDGSRGYADIDNSIPNRPDTRHRIGSVTKPFTAVIMLQLANEEKLDLQQPLSDFFDGFPSADDITLEHLLYHRSGLFNFTNDPEYTSWMTEPKTRDELLDLTMQYDLQFDPGTYTEYSNTNYILLGFIIEEVTGGSYQEALETRITGPLGLSDTFYGRETATDGSEAFSYAFSDEWKKQPQTDMSIPHGAGALISTPSDLVRFGRALFSGELLDENGLRKMTDLQGNFGMGLMRNVYHDQSGFGHSGGIDGFQANLAIFPDDELYMAFTANAMSYSGNELMIAMLDAWHGEPVSLPDFGIVELPEKHLKLLAGEYESEQIPLGITISQRNGTLIIQATGQPPVAMEASSPTLFRFDRAGLVIEFHPDEENEEKSFRSFTLTQAGQEYLFKRK